METQSDKIASIDIAQIRQEALRPTSHQYEPNTSASTREGQHTEEHCQHSTTAASPAETNLTLRDAQPESLPFLPNVVLESRDNTHPVSQELKSPTKTDGADVSQNSGRMWSQGEPVDSTQPISQSIYQNLISKSKSSRLGELQREAGSMVAMSQSLSEGHAGHVDIMSSFVTYHDEPEPFDDSEPADFPPTQSQLPLTQFPESQRFKTPATAAKKRRYNGDIVETPSLPRNPLAKSFEVSPANPFGLSQAFAATQAPSSPFSNGLPTVLRSDRPSPHVELQTRPASSPLGPPITRRAATQPAAQYVSVQQSQAERDQLAMLGSDEDADTETTSDNFNETSSFIRRQEDKNQREKRVMEELREITWDRSPEKLRRSAWRKVGRGAISASAEPVLESAPNFVSDQTSDRSASGAETEEDQDIEIDVRRSSQTQHLHEAEDKENQDDTIPESTYRRPRLLNGFVSEIEASPSTRHANAMLNGPNIPDFHSSEPFRVADSQPSQNQGHQSLPARPVATSGIDSLDFVPQSSTNLEQIPSKQYKNTRARSKTPNISDLPADERSLSETSLNKVQSDTPAVTTAHEKGLMATESSSNNKSTAVENSGSGRTSTTTYDTAPVHQVPEITVGSSQQSSPPIHTTPPGRRRRRLAEISEEASPMKSQTPSGFDASAILQLDLDPEMAVELARSPLKPAANVSRRRRASNKAISNDSVVIDSSPAQNDQTDKSTPVGSVEHQQQPAAGHILEPSQEVVRPVRQSALRQPTNDLVNPKPPPRSRKSIWDLDDGSPQKPSRSAKKQKTESVVKFQSRLEQRLNGEAVYPDAITEQKTGENQVSIEDTVASTGQTTATSAYGETSLEEIVAPNMVFACFNGKTRAYYPAVCIGLAGSDARRYRVQWEGYDPDEIDAYGVKALDIRINDAVKISMDGFAKVPYIIQGFKNKVEGPSDCITDIRGYRTIVVAPKQRKSLPGNLTSEARKEVPIGAIYLDSNMWNQLKMRDFDFTPSTETVAQSGLATPVDGTDTPVTPSSRARRRQADFVPSISSCTDGLFTNMLFAISYEDTTRKNLLSGAIHDNGGLVLLDSFHELFEPNSIKLRSQYSNLGFTALLAERHSRKEKYMQALALGLPCISGRWVDACVRQSKLVDWRAYLLPAGESAELDGATRSRILPEMDPANVKLTTMLELRPNLFHDEALIMVTGRGKAEAKRASYLFLVQVLGAGEIEKVPDIKSAKEMIEASRKTTTELQYQRVFVDDRDLASAQSILEEDNPSSSKRKSKHSGPKESQCRVAGNELIVQSLILGRLFED